MGGLRRIGENGKYSLPRLLLLMPVLESRSGYGTVLQTQICIGRDTDAQSPVLLKAETASLKHPNSQCPMTASPLKWALTVQQLVIVTSFKGAIRSP